jgi:lysophospholipase L1-like esterase
MKRFLYLLAGFLVFTGMLCMIFAGASSNETTEPAWAAPTAKALRRVSPIASAQHEPNFLNNLDCSLIDYRNVSGSEMKTGCFTPTAFGLLDSDSGTVIFNGTDEGLPLTAYSPHQVLAPWPQALNIVALDPAITDGSYISLYKNPLVSLQDQRNILLKLTGKRLTAPPDIRLKDTAGNPLVINPQTIAFSDGGSWLVAETLGGSFVRINLATLDMTAFAPAFGSTGSPALLKSRVAVSDDGNYIAIANNVAESFKIYDLSTCSGQPLDLQPRNCRFYDYLPFIKDQIGGLQSVRHVRFVNDGLINFEAQSSIASKSGIYVMAPTESINSLIDYLGLGDSYTSGEGAFDYVSGTDSDNNSCHLSAYSYPLLLTRDLFSSIGGHSVACSGAVINDIGSKDKTYKGQVRGVVSFEQLQGDQHNLLGSVMTNYMPGYIAQQRFVAQFQPKVTTVMIGGNDIGFGDIIQSCVLPHVSLHASDSTCYNTYEDRLEVLSLIDRTVPRWTALYQQLIAQAPGTNLYVIGYPSLVYNNGNCALNVHLNKSELEFAEQLVDYLNSAIQTAAAKADVNYVDISQALVGHRLCEAASYNVAVNGLTAGKDGGLLGINVLGKESYHPNRLGHELIEQTILQKTRNFANPTKPVVILGDNTSILNAPKTGRDTITKVPANNPKTTVAKKSKPTAVKATGKTTGLIPRAIYTVHIDGPAGPIAGSISTNDEGDIDGTITIPNQTTSGSHTLDIIGNNQTDETVDITQPIYVPVDDNDSDGDGISDGSDSCPSAVNSGVDVDHDSVDDTCDGFIDQPPNTTNVTTLGDATSNGSTPPSNSSSLTNDSVSVVTSFVTPKDTSKAVNLGTNTANPHSTQQKTHLSPTTTKQSPSHSPLTKLPVIDVLYWSTLIIIAWVIILLIYLYISHVFGEQRGHQNTRELSFG